MGQVTAHVLVSRSKSAHGVLSVAGHGMQPRAQAKLALHVLQCDPLVAAFERVEGDHRCVWQREEE